MLLEVCVGDNVQMLLMIDGCGEVYVVLGMLVIVDLYLKVLCDMFYIDVFCYWMEEQQKVKV